MKFLLNHSDGNRKCKYLVQYHQRYKLSVNDPIRQIQNAQTFSDWAGFVTEHMLQSPLTLIL